MASHSILDFNCTAALRRRGGFTLVFIALVTLAGCKTLEAVKADLGVDSTPEQTAEAVEVPADQAELVSGVQRMLKEKGFNPGPIDGKEGPGTRAALHAFQTKNGLEITEGVTDTAYRQLAADSSGTATAVENEPEEDSDERDCVRNFKKQRGLRNYQTTATLTGVSVGEAMKRLHRTLNRRGFIINKNDPSQGYISGTFDAGQSDLQISAFVERKGSRTQVELNYAGTGAGLGTLITPASAYRNELCSFVEAMQAGR